MGWGGGVAETRQGWGVTGQGEDWEDRGVVLNWGGHVALPRAGRKYHAQHQSDGHGMTVL